MTGTESETLDPHRQTVDAHHGDPQAHEDDGHGLAGATFEHRFEAEGVYDIDCAPHEALWMIGSVIVGEPDPHDQPGLGAPQPDMSEAVTTKIVSLNHAVNEALGHTHDEQKPTSTDTEGHNEAEAGHQGDDERTNSGHHGEEDTGHHGDDADIEAGHHDGESESGHSH